MSDKDLILVLGAARSGTSALTRIISLCGCSLPQSVFGATSLNPTGHWEPVDATKLNVDFVSRHGIVADPSMRLDEIDISESDKEDFIGRIQHFLSECPRTPSLVIKEARINELMQFWLTAASREGFTTKVVIIVRHPQEVFASTKKGFYPSHFSASTALTTTPALSIEKFNTFWLKINLLAERNSRALPRLFVEYSNLLQNWRTEVRRITTSLSVDLEVDETAIDEYLTPSLYHQRCSDLVTETFAYSWTTRTYAALSAAAQGRPLDHSTLDEIYHAYRTTARTFRISMSEVGSISTAEHLQKFVDTLPIWKADRDF